MVLGWSTKLFSARNTSLICSSSDWTAATDAGALLMPERRLETWAAAARIPVMEAAMLSGSINTEY